MTNQHDLETLHVYPPNRGPELFTVLQLRPLQVLWTGQAPSAYSGSVTPALYIPGSFAPFAPQLYIEGSYWGPLNWGPLLEGTLLRSPIWGCPKTDHWGTPLLYNSGPVRMHTIDDDPLPPSCQPVLYQGSNITLDAHGSNLPHEPFVRVFLYWRLSGSPKRLHPRHSNGHTHRTCIGKSQGGLKQKTYPDENHDGSC